PDERTVARVVFLDAGFLLDHLWAIEPDARLTGRHQVAAQPGSDAHAAEAADRTRHHADHRLVFAQLDDGRLDLGDGGQTQVGLLQAYTASFQQQHGAGGNAVAVVLGGQLQAACDLRAADLAHAAALEGAFDGGDHRRLAEIGRAHV